MAPITDPTLAITLIVASGVFAQWLGARLRTPAILPLLFMGCKRDGTMESRILGA